MGATDFRNRGIGTTIQKAFNDEREESIAEYGNDSYSGTIGTKSSVQDVTSEFKRSKKKLDDFIWEKTESAYKWGCAFGICTKEPKGNSNKVKTQVDHVVTKGAKKWETKYVVTSGGNEIGAKDTKGEAVKCARAHTEKTQERTNIDIEKRIKGGSTRVASISYKKSSKESLGEYVFFGIAPC